MEEQVLKDPDKGITEDLLESELGKLYPVFREFMDCIETEPFGFTPEWRYYKDGKAWLCKITHRKKTVAWLSAWKHCFKVGLYFTEKTGAGIGDLDISESLKRAYEDNPMVGKLKPVTLEIDDNSQLQELYVLLEYKAGIR